MKNLHTYIARSIVARFTYTRVAAVDVTDDAIMACLGKGGQLVFRGSSHPYDGDYVLAAPGQEDMRIPVKRTLAEARAILGPEMSLSHKDGEYRVNYNGGKESTASYTNDLEDAISTGVHMRDNRTFPHWERTAHGVYRAGKAAVFWSIDQGNEAWSAYVGDVHQGTVTEHDLDADPNRDLRHTLLEAAWKLCDHPITLANPEVHAQLIALGYRHTHSPAEGAGGDAESGPDYRSAHDAFDTYESATDYVVIDHRGHFVHYELRDLELEAFVNGQRSA